jgi:hypothetical protein
VIAGLHHFKPVGDVALVLNNGGKERRKEIGADLFGPDEGRPGIGPYSHSSQRRHQCPLDRLAAFGCQSVPAESRLCDYMSVDHLKKPPPILDRAGTDELAQQGNQARNALIVTGIPVRIYQGIHPILTAKIVDDLPDMRPFIQWVLIPLYVRDIRTEVQDSILLAPVAAGAFQVKRRCGNSSALAVS